MIRPVAAIALWVGLAGPVWGQVTPPVSRQTRVIPAGRDTSRRADSLARLGRRADSTRDSLTVRWVEPDSVMKALVARPGYEVTKFQAGRAIYDAKSKDLRLDASGTQRAAVDRNGQVAVSDSSIYYNETTKNVTNLGHYTIEIPGSTEAPIRGFGRWSYNSAERSGQFTNAKLPFNNGETWYLDIAAGAVQLSPDSSGKPPTIYIDQGATLTSCPDSLPDYHFSIKTAKRTPANTVVGRNVLLYIGDVPVMWLPFIVQNVHGGRNSGMLTTRFSLSDIVRNSPTYHRNIENLGYYWALSDYMDLAGWVDWRSGAGGSNSNDPGWFKSNFDYEYKWLDRFLGGRVGGSYWVVGDGSKKFDLGWGHHQTFSNEGNLSLDFNYTTNTTIQQRNTFDPIATLATIHSQAQFSRKLGPATFSIGGDRTQYPGREEVDTRFPTLQISSAPINLGPHVVWTPNFSYDASSQRNLDQTGRFAFLYFRDSLTGNLDSSKIRKSSYMTSVAFGTPLKVFNQDFGNSFSIRSRRQDFPDQFTLHDVISGDSTGTRIYAQTFETDVDWTPTFQLPPLGQNRFNLAPSITLANVDPGPFWIATERTNGQFVSQGKRLAYGLSASPTIYGLFGGLGPFSAFRHSITPTIGYTYAPAGHVSDEYLQALGRWRKGYVGDITQNQISFGMSTALEGKVTGPNDSTPEQGTKLKIVSVNMSSFAYNISRLHSKEITNKAWWAGLTTERFNYSLHSDLLPGIEFSSDYSLFQGSTTSDTAVFKPYREGMTASLTLSRDQNPFAVLTKLFGKAAPTAQHAPVAPADTTGLSARDAAAARELATQPVAGVRTSGERFVVPPSQGWRLALTLSSSRPRPPVGGNVIDYDPAAQ
ncbi:MAG TPA: putative LPS assembly protein LptD, partial [Gemmatimonadaceae bacterium]